MKTLTSVLLCILNLLLFSYWSEVGLKSIAVPHLARHTFSGKMCSIIRIPRRMGHCEKGRTGTLACPLQFCYSTRGQARVPVLPRAASTLTFYLNERVAGCASEAVMG